MGDELYGSTIGKRLLLCATEIKVMHPDEGTLVSAKIELPHSFTDYIEREEKRFAMYEKWMKESYHTPNSSDVDPSDA